MGIDKGYGEVGAVEGNGFDCIHAVSGCRCLLTKHELAFYTAITTHGRAISQECWKGLFLYVHY